MGIVSLRACVTVSVVLLVLLALAGPAAALGPTPQELLGEQLFFDAGLSEPAGQSCATCHAPGVGWTGPDEAINAAGGVMPGAVPERFGNRKPPSAAYAGDSPLLHYDALDGVWVGGMFWDGRATGDTLGDPLAEQALGPFLNPAEMNNASAADVVAKVESSAYRELFAEVYADATPTVGEAYEAIGRAIAAFERSAQVSSFTSKYDAYLAGTVRLTGQEMRGLQLFNGKAKCSLCHLSGQGLAGEPPLFTDFTYDNLGIPRNDLNPFYFMPYNLDGEAWVDPGLGGFLQAAGYPADVYAPEMGKHKVPTLRNVALAPSKHFVKAFGHNAYFKDLWSIVHFYNTRDVPGAGWLEPEYAATVNTTELGDLGLNRGEERALVAFMETLSDGFVPVRGH